ncbi:hypothetical protein Acsp06_44500 [Actinomycetospora sp. NBRC 106375]|uniref:hypothetical protein n=1 Tax=Actinomycetospora sp. NBRC 106375 TaxID=3032207 RepID=UPI0024A15AB2|nr:hypothetical protein [Actinomycetospora sp. NBRC 106375]GLZ48265.1 hypothetical protein Acsp06_44500 [Actinomycetospora sp. NBRC 106375]
MPENQRAAQRAHENVGLPDEYYDGEGRPAAARARDADADAQEARDREPEQRDAAERDT